MTTYKAHAQPITANVIGPRVSDKGQFGIEYRTGFEQDNESAVLDDAFTDRIDLFYNVTDDSQFRVFFNRVETGTQNAEFTNLFIEPQFQLFNQAEHGFDGAILTGLTVAEGDNTPGQARVVLAGEIPLGEKFAFRHNSIIAHQWGADSVSGMRYEARWRAYYHMFEKHSIGLEMMNNFGNVRTTDGFDEETHRAGVMAEGTLYGDLGYQTGVLAGISKGAPDVAYKFWLNYTF